jgi:phage terminase small subunit
MKLQKLSRKQAIESLKQVPAHTVLSANRKLTHKQKQFCANIVEGMTQTEAMNKAYKYKGKRKTMSDDASRLAKDPRIAAEIEALERAKQFAANHTAAQIRQVVISQLFQEAINEEAKPSERIQALAKLGQVSEISAFTIRTEQTIHKPSDDIKAKILEQLKQAMKDNARTVDSDADELLAKIGKGRAIENQQDTDPTTGHPPKSKVLLDATTHSNPHTQSPEISSQAQQGVAGDVATLPDEPTPSVGKKQQGEGV